MRMYITFGQNHVHHCKNVVLDKDCVVTYECETEEAGRQRAFELFGRQWAFCHTRLQDVQLAFYPRGLFEM